MMIKYDIEAVIVPIIQIKIRHKSNRDKVVVNRHRLLFKFKQVIALLL